MKRVMGLAGLFVLLGWTVTAAAGQERWWNTGHSRITQGAVTHLPEPLLGFFEAEAATVGYYSGVEPPNSHWFHRNVYPESFPHDLAQLIAEYGVEFVEANGTAPWSAETYAGTLAVQMSAAVTSTDWTNLLPTAGALAHYLEDLHNPLHTTTNYDGQETGNNGIHYRYEGVMISQHLADLAITPSPADCVYYDPSATPLIDAIFASIDVTYPYVDDLMAADTAAAAADPNHGATYYAALWAATGGFTHDLFQDASEMVASAWYTSWINAGSPAPILPGIIGDLNCDGTVDFGDINPFVLYESNFAGWQGTFPGCDPLNGDIDQDGTWGQGSFGDINPFVTLLVGDR